MQWTPEGDGGSWPRNGRRRRQRQYSGALPEPSVCLAQPSAARLPPSLSCARATPRSRPRVSPASMFVILTSSSGHARAPGGDTRRTRALPAAASTEATLASPQPFGARGVQARSARQQRPQAPPNRLRLTGTLLQGAREAQRSASTRRRRKQRGKECHGRLCRRVPRSGRCAPLPCAPGRRAAPRTCPSRYTYTLEPTSRCSGASSLPCITRGGGSHAVFVVSSAARRGAARVRARP